MFHHVLLFDKSFALKKVLLYFLKGIVHPKIHSLAFMSGSKPVQGPMLSLSILLNGKEQGHSATFYYFVFHRRKSKRFGTTWRWEKFDRTFISIFGLIFCYAKFILQTSEVAFICLSTDYLILIWVGINAFTLHLWLYTLILGAEVGLKRHNLAWLLCGIESLHWILSRHWAASTHLC